MAFHWPSGRLVPFAPVADVVPRGSIGRILPPGVLWVEQRGQLSGTLLAEEHQALNASACLERQREFAAGRSCARAAIERLGMRTGPILRGDAGQPIWPAEAVGSITHCSGYCAAVVAPAVLFHSVGIDAEIDEPLPAGVRQSVACERELRWLSSARPGSMHWDRLLFSIKESVFKAWYPVRGSLIEARNIEVTVHPRKATFDATVFALPPDRIFPPGLQNSFRIKGRYAAGDGLILTAATLPRKEPVR